jgi:hypothetical protein
MTSRERQIWDLISAGAVIGAVIAAIAIVMVM